MNIAIVGATGNVGRKMLEVLEHKKLPVDKLYLVASAKSAGQKIIFNGKEHEVYNLETYDFSKAEITFFVAGGKISEQYAEKASKHTIIIDNSSFFRMDPAVPLIVPQVNPEAINDIKKNIIANPNCSTAQLVIVLKPLHDEFEIKRVVISTYQSVSGGGKAPMDELIEQTKLSLDNQKIISPCISICKTDYNTGYCYGCARTEKEKIIWKGEETSDKWKDESITELLSRMTGWQ